MLLRNVRGERIGFSVWGREIKEQNYNTKNKKVLRLLRDAGTDGLVERGMVGGFRLEKLDFGGCVEKMSRQKAEEKLNYSL
ncbi:MAG: hypothetical protein JSV82_05270 [Planctomycetota bacterium]|nr:MAG: hypothetical protein JSV82_05270 [Planctomycetota bacterium]